MTVANTVRYVDYDYTSPGITTYAYPFLVYDEDHLVVVKTESDGVTETLLTKTTHYSVTGVGTRTGGNVELVTALATDESLHIERSVPLTQLIDYINSGTFTPENYEEGLDLTVMAIQQTLAAALAASSAVYVATTYTTDGSGTARPTASADYEGMIIYVKNVGTAGEYQGCAESAGGTWAWSTLATGFPF